MNTPTFNRNARRPAPQVQDPPLQWATGLQTKERRIYAGWLVEAGKLDDLDRAMEQTLFNQVTIKHGSGNMVTHWAIETANIYLIAEGVQSIAETKRTADRYGIAFGWKTLEGGRQQSQLKARVILAELWAVGYTDPLLLTVKSTLTGDLIAAFTRQYDVLDAAGGNLPLYALSLPIGPGAEVARGSGGQTKEITPPVALIPTPITESYIAERWIPQDACNAIEAMLDDTIRWSVEASAAIGTEDAQPQSASYSGLDESEEETKFYNWCEARIGGRGWRHVQSYLGVQAPMPTNTEGWRRACEMIKAESQHRVARATPPRPAARPHEDLL